MSKKEMEAEKRAALGESKRGRKAKPKKIEQDGFKVNAWDGVTMEPEKKYWCVRQKADMHNKGLTSLALAEDPSEAVEGVFLGYELKRGSGEAFTEVPPTAANLAGYAFDDGRLARRLEYLSITVEDREHHIYPLTKEGKKAAEAYVESRRARNKSLIEAARHKDEEHAKEVAEEEDVTLDDLLVMAVALGGNAKTLESAGKSRQRKIAAILALRPTWFEKAGAAPKLAERKSTRDLAAARK